MNSHQGQGIKHYRHTHRTARISKIGVIRHPRFWVKPPTASLEQIEGGDVVAEHRGVKMKRGPPVGVAGVNDKDNNKSSPLGLGDHMSKERVCRS